VKPRIAVPHWKAPTWERTKYYLDSIDAAGGEHVILEGAELPGDIRGLVLLGGVDVDPALYGEKLGPKTDRPHKERDAQELALLRLALGRDIPVLCICRGHQLLNVAMGGSLVQDIENGHTAGRTTGHPAGTRSRWMAVVAWRTYTEGRGAARQYTAPPGIATKAGTACA
jgi:gamma-glutamyl-gamma-aminobutyrate hydrolase PuuD